MNLHLNDKIVVVTGGTKGIGLAIVKGFLKEGASVHILSRSQDASLETELGAAFPCKAFFYQCDVTDEASLKKKCEEILKTANGIIDVVISNIGNGKSVLDPISEDSTWTKLWNINFNTALYTSRIFYPQLSQSKGSILFISSIAGLEFIGAPTDYSTAKSALISFSKSLSHRLAPLVRVNVIAPGNIFTEEGTWGIKIKEDPEKVKEMLEKKVPLKRFGLPEEVSDLTIFLSSKRAAFITGACFVIDGGQTVQF